MESHTNPTFKICIVGAGLSGMCAGIQLKTQLNLNSFTIFDNQSDYGGVWMANAYPGCACDLPVHYYCFSFEPNPDWSSNYCSQSEIQAYLQNIAKKYDLYSDTRFNTEVKSMIWDENLKKWNVTIFDKQSGKTQELLFDLIFNGAGKLTRPNIPKVFESFGGPIMHSAKWNPEIDLKNKTVAVVGGSSSAAQIIPAVAKVVKNLHVYQNEPQYVLPYLVPQFKFPEKIKRLFAHVPVLMFLFRAFLFMVFQLYYFAVQSNSYVNRLFKFLAINNLKKQVPDNKSLQIKLTPKMPFLCRLFLTSATYLSTLNLSHVVAHFSEIVDVIGNTIVTEDGNREKFDVVILATGFQTSDYFGIKTVGKNSEDILVSWKENGPRLYWGIVSSNMPNFFHLLGPNGGTWSAFTFAIECHVNFSIKLIREMMKRKATSFNVKVEAENEYMEAMREKMKTTVGHSYVAKSWITDKQGVHVMFNPYHCVHYWWKTRNIDCSKFDFTVSK